MLPLAAAALLALAAAEHVDGREHRPLRYPTGSCITDADDAEGTLLSAAHTALLDVRSARLDCATKTFALASIDTGAGRIALAAPDPSFMRGARVRLADAAGGACPVLPKGVDLRIASVDDDSEAAGVLSVGTRSLAQNGTLAEGVVSSECVLQRVSTRVSYYRDAGCTILEPAATVGAEPLLSLQSALAQPGK